jgi:formate transporter
MAWASGRVTTQQVMSNWGWADLGNLVGAIGTAVLVWLAGVHTMSNDAVGEAMVQIAQQDRARFGLGPGARRPLHRAGLSGSLVVHGRAECDPKILATVFPITAFVAGGFEHSVANMYLLQIGVALAAGTSAPLSVTDAVSNLVLVTLGNILGGTVLVALVYWSVYLRYSN